MNRQQILNPVLPGIDVLRGVAIGMVVIHHFYLGIIKPVGSNEFSTAYLPVFPFIAEHGYLGVKLFFVVSGFCIHCSYLRWRQRSPALSLHSFWPEFFVRRFFRIVPPYFVALLIFWSFQYLPDGLQIRDLKHLAVHGFLVQNINQAFFWNINHSFWSIAVEWQLYLIYPLFLVLLGKAGTKIALLIAAVTTIGIHNCIPETYFVVRHSPFAYWLQWVCGASLANCLSMNSPSPRTWDSARWNRAWMPILSVVAMAGCFRYCSSYSIKDVVSTVAMSLIVLASLDWRCSSLVSRALIRLGVVSYSLYLLHQPLIRLIPKFADSRPESEFLVLSSMFFLVYFLAACGLASFFFVAFEKPSVRLGKRCWSLVKPRFA